MRIGVPREIKDGERRVGLTPAGARASSTPATRCASSAAPAPRSDSPTRDYRAAGASSRRRAPRVWSCDLVVKVKEVLPPEYPLLTAGTTVFGFAQINRDPRASRGAARRRASR